MLIFVFLTIFLNFNAHYLEAKLSHKLTVMASQIKPFVFYENRLLKGLEVDMIENFAKQFNLSIEYIVTNESLNEIFNSKDHAEKWFKSIKNK